MTTSLNRETLIPLLKEIAQVLERSGHQGQAEYVSALATVTYWDVTAVQPGLTSGAMWGGSGSVFDVGTFNSKDEHRKSLHLLLQLAEEIRRAGINSSGAEFAATAIPKWLESGIV